MSMNEIQAISSKLEELKNERSKIRFFCVNIITQNENYRTKYRKYREKKEKNDLKQKVKRKKTK